MGVDARLDSLVAGYRVERLLGRGGMGAVYLADDVQLARKVALKLLVPELSEDASFRERFLRESRIAAGLEHPNVVPIYQAGDADGTLFIAMRYVEGTDLKRLLADVERLDRATIASVASQVAAALDAAHRRGLVHRDVKPGNVLLAADGHVYLSDFGLTKQAASQSGLTATGQLVGTLDYVAPEQIQGQPVDGRADVYSLACLLQECLTGTPPFRRDTDVATLWAHVQEPPPATGDDAVDAVLARGLAKDPDQRFASAGELAAEWKRALDVTSSQLTVPSRPARKPNRRVLLLAAMTLLVLAAAATAVLVNRGGSAGPVSLRPFSLAVLDAKSGKVVGDIPLGGGAATRAAVAPSAVWVANQNDQTLSRIDPRTRAIVKTVGLSFTPADIAASAGTVWLADPDGANVTAFDASTATEIGSTRVRDRSRNYFKVTPSVLAFGAGGVWADAGIDEIVRIGNVARVIRVSSGDYAVDGLAFGAGGLWFVDDRSAVVAKIDPADDRVTTTVQVGSASAPQAPLLQSVAAGPSGVWTVGLPPIGANGAAIDTSKAATLYRIDPRTGSVASAITIGHLQGHVTNASAGVAGAVAPIAVGMTAVWAGNSGDRTLSMIDAASAKIVRTIKLGHTPLWITAGARYVWVTIGR